MPISTSKRNLPPSRFDFTAVTHPFTYFLISLNVFLVWISSNLVNPSRPPLASSRPLSPPLASSCLLSPPSSIMWAGMIPLINYTGVNAWFWLWSFISLLVLVLNTLWPIFIAPCFNTFTPLEDGPVRAGIQKLVKDTGLNCKKVFMVDGSKQSSHSNAYVAVRRELERRGEKERHSLCVCCVWLCDCVMCAVC